MERIPSTRTLSWWTRRRLIAAGTVALLSAGPLAACAESADDCVQSFTVGEGLYTHMPIEYGNAEAMITISPPMGNTTAVQLSGDASGDFNLARGGTSQTSFGSQNLLVLRINQAGSELSTSCVRS